ncbi:arylformamidase [Virgibacillus necropolis]|uniref:Kynurenine formamidase n=1 Tax=Virgibacillus necropolis TaxID=163877 RepID=A0A221MH18_9BACI|nr:arylformamidase [Virgibacillus necropolis]ASN06920.1 arylformamidase [Virgibacillus necropolis]
MAHDWIDISQPLTNDIAHWPEDAPFSYSLTVAKKDSGSVNIGQVTTSVHTGTHVDAPFHFDDNGQTIDQLDVNLYVGEAMVIDVSHVDEVTVETLANFSFDGIKRVLLKTSHPNDPTQFPEKIPTLDPRIANLLAEKGVKLLGVNMPSVDALDSKDLATHHALYKNGINILENLMLDKIDQGNYELIALPLAIEGSDGSPVRAVLRPL